MTDNVNDLLTKARLARNSHKNHACPLVGDFDDCYSCLERARDLLDETITAMKEHQNTSAPGCDDCNLSEKIRKIERFLR